MRSIWLLLLCASCGSAPRLVPASEFPGTLVATWPPDTAVVRIGEKKYSVAADEELDGWILVECGPTSAVFRRGDRQVLLERSNSAPGIVRKREGPYDPSNYATRLISGSEESGRLTWDMDPEEVAWLERNLDSVLENEVRLSPYGGGGFIVEDVAPGSIATARGIRINDVVKSLDGIRLDSLGDFRKFQTTRSGKTKLRIEVERAGRVLVLEYRVKK